MTSDGDLTPREAHLRRVELLDDLHHDQEGYLAAKDSLAAPAPRTQTEESGAVPRPAWADCDLTELYPPVYDAPEVQFRLFPKISRPLPAGGHEPTGLIDTENYLATDVYATGEASWIPNHPQSHVSQTVDYDRLEEWLDKHLQATEPDWRLQTHRTTMLPPLQLGGPMQ